MPEKPTYASLEKRVKELEELLSAKAGVEESRLKRILDEVERMVDLGSFEWDIVRDKWIMSENWLRIHGCSKAPADFADLLTLAHPDDIDRIKEAFYLTMEKGEPYRLEHRIVRRDNGEVRYVRVHGNAELGEDGKPARIIGAGIDIT